MNKTLFETVPNKHKLTPKDIKRLKILDWDRLKKACWHNDAMLSGSWWCHLEGCQLEGKRYNDEDEFWIGFRENDNKVDFHFSCYGGMCAYKFDKFYDANDYENDFDIGVQVNAIRWLNVMLDEKILGLNNDTQHKKKTK